MALGFERTARFLLGPAIGIIFQWAVLVDINRGLAICHFFPCRRSRLHPAAASDHLLRSFGAFRGFRSGTNCTWHVRFFNGRFSGSDRTVLANEDTPCTAPGGCVWRPSSWPVAD